MTELPILYELQQLNNYMRFFLVIIGVGISFAGAWLIWIYLRRLLNRYVNFKL